MHRAEWSAGDQLMAAARLKVYVCVREKEYVWRFRHIECRQTNFPASCGVNRSDGKPDYWGVSACGAVLHNVSTVDVTMTGTYHPCSLHYFPVDDVCSLSCSLTPSGVGNRPECHKWEIWLWRHFAAGRRMSECEDWIEAEGCGWRTPGQGEGTALKNWFSMNMMMCIIWQWKFMRIVKWHIVLVAHELEGSPWTFG